MVPAGTDFMSRRSGGGFLGRSMDCQETRRNRKVDGDMRCLLGSRDMMSQEAGWNRDMHSEVCIAYTGDRNMRDVRMK